VTESINYKQQIQVADEADVLVTGGGPAGLAAAIAAARNGARTLLVERYGFLGGNLTAGLVGPCMTSYSLDGRTQLIKGIFEEMILRMETLGAAMHPSKVQAGSEYSGFIVYGHDKVTPFSPEAVKQVAMDMCLEAGVVLRLHTFVVDALVDGGALTGIVVASKSGLEALRATAAVDCSGDGDVAAYAGVPFEIGRQSDGLTQPMTLFFRVAGVDDERVKEYVRTHPDDYRPFASLVQQARQRGEFPIPRRGIGLYRTLETGVWRINTTRIQHRLGTSVTDLTQAEIEGRHQVQSLLRFFRGYLPGFERSELLDTATQVGVRETRRIAGEYTLTLEDLVEGKQFEDVIALAGYPVDIHSPTDDGGGSSEQWHTANIYEIPYRSLVPQSIDGLLVAGRCISATHEALGAVRVMPPAFAMGQAAGTAAALAVERGIPPRRVSVPELQRLLVEQGAYIGDRTAGNRT